MVYWGEAIRFRSTDLILEMVLGCILRGSSQSVSPVSTTLRVLSYLKRYPVLATAQLLCAVIGTLMISLGLEMVRVMETGPTLLGIKFPQMLGLSGLLLGVVIVVVMAFKPEGFMGNREAEDILLRRQRKEDMT